LQLDLTANSYIQDTLPAGQSQRKECERVSKWPPI
jgi:hypothetical protein